MKVQTYRGSKWGVGVAEVPGWGRDLPSYMYMLSVNSLEVQ